MTKLDNKTLKQWLSISAFVVLIMFGISIWGATRPGLGDEICIHWNAAGVCDGYGGKFIGFYMLPLVFAGVVALVAAIPFIEPRRTNITLSRTAYLAIWTGMLGYFLVLHLILVVNALYEAGAIDFNLEIAQFVPVLVGGLFVVLGNYLGKIRSNFLMGIRTPWTLSSDLSWNKTHRLGGKLFVFTGLLMIISALVLPASWWIGVMLGMIMIMLVILVVYSFVIWKNDPDARNGFQQET